ncbi:HEAT repeat domain-containing protein [Candidatus Magnetominusculus dajiuhuensis]|uniref:HEAT repeat domain-containing protein n=1 Tax=Candidatus Magnetominusculus dajiuhuensis TaxID=3137712 RepID=UPI003B4380A0
MLTDLKDAARQYRDVIHTVKTSGDSMFEGSKIKKLIAELNEAKTESDQSKAVEALVVYGRKAYPRIIDAFRNRRLHQTRAKAVLFRLCDFQYMVDILQLIGEPNEEIRRTAKELILKKYADAAAQPLLDYLRSADSNFRMAAVDLLCTLRSKSCVPMLMAMYGEGDSEQKKNIIRILGETDAPGITKLLISALSDTSLSLRIQAVRALAVLKDPECVVPLTQLLAEDDTLLKRAVLEALAAIGDKRAAPAVLNLLKDVDLVIRQKSTECVIQLADASIVPDIIKLMRDKDVNVRRCAVDVLNNVRDPSTADTLVAAMKDSDWWVRQIATDALAEVKGENIVKFFIAMLKDSSDVNVRRCAVEFFNKVTDPLALEPLIATLNDTDWWVREKVVTALGALKDKRAVAALSSVLDDSEIKWVIPSALASIGGQEVIEPLFVLLADSEKRVRVGAVKALGKLKNPDTITKLKEMLDDHEDEVRLEAVNALKEITGRVFKTGDGKQQQQTLKTMMGFVLPEGSIQTEAILVLDLCNSTGIANKYGDQFALDLTKTLTEKVRPIAAKEGCRFMKSTGDGFLITFPKVVNAIRFAFTILKEIAAHNETQDDSARIQLRFAINQGETRIDAKGDRLGVATNMTFRVEGVKGEDLIPLEGSMKKEELPLVDRVLVTEHVIEDALQIEGIKSRLVGLFELKGISGLHRVYLITNT